MFLLIPYKRLTIKTPLSMQNAEERLAANVSKRQLFRWGWPFNSTNEPPFNGTVANGRFNISRTIHYRNSFLPVITGEFHDDLDMTRIDIRMRLHYFVIIFLGIFLSSIVVNSISSIFSPYLSMAELSVSQFFAAGGGMGLFLYLLTMLPFNYEALRAQQELEKMFSSSDMMGDEGKTAVFPH